MSTYSICFCVEMRESDSTVWLKKASSLELCFGSGCTCMQSDNVTIFTLNMTPYFLTILVLKFEYIHFT